MKNFLIILTLSLFLFISCAKPTVVNVILPKDSKLNCDELEKAVSDAQEFRQKALAVTGNTGKNQLRSLLFWPALMVTYVNAHEAIVAASERSVYLINLMSDKNCKNVDKVLSHVAFTPRLQTLKDLTEAYKGLLELYKSGALTEDEFRKEKKQILGQ